jgi:penicillin amidase
LREWDGCVAPDSTAATVFEVFMVYLAQRIAQEVAPRSAATALGQGYSELLPYNLLFTRRMAHLSKLIRTQPPKLLTTSWSTLLEQGLSQAYGTLLKQLGSPGKKWEWGTARNLVLQHPFGKNKLLSGLFNSRPIRCGGDATTIAQAAVDFLNPRSNPVGVATCRVVIDVGAWENSRFIVLGGQSGNPFLPQYSDQIAAWERGEGIPIHTTEKDIERHTQWHLRLAPR